MSVTSSGQLFAELLIMSNYGLPVWCISGHGLKS